MALIPCVARFSDPSEHLLLLPELPFVRNRKDLGGESIMHTVNQGNFRGLSSLFSLWPSLTPEIPLMSLENESVERNHLNTTQIGVT